MLKRVLKKLKMGPIMFKGGVAKMKWGLEKLKVGPLKFKGGIAKLK